MPSQPREIPGRAVPLQIPTPFSVTLPPPSSASKLRHSYLQLDTFSPVNQNGSFEFDRVLKSGFVQKRTRKTKVDVLLLGPLIQSLMKYIGLEAHFPCPATPFSLDIQR